MQGSEEEEVAAVRSQFEFEKDMDSDVSAAELSLVALIGLFRFYDQFLPNLTKSGGFDTAKLLHKVHAQASQNPNLSLNSRLAYIVLITSGSRL